MAELSLGALVERGFARSVIGDAAVRFRGIKHDSRRIEPGDLFAAVSGVRHGTEFAPDAIARGAVAVLSDRVADLSVPLVLCDDTLVALAAIARALYDDPDRRHGRRRHHRHQRQDHDVVSGRVDACAPPAASRR